MSSNAGFFKASRAVTAALALTCGLSAASQSEESRASKHYVLHATTDNVQWGWYDVNEKPRLTVRSGGYRLHRDTLALPWAD
jgi:hypothetical protein